MMLMCRFNEILKNRGYGRMFFMFLVLTYFNLAESSRIAPGTTNCKPSLQQPRFDVQHQKSLSVLSVTAGLLMRPKNVLAALPISPIPLSIPPIPLSIPITTAAFQSAAIPIVPKIVTKVAGKIAANDEESVLNSLISGAATRVAKELVLHPIDTVRARLQKKPDLLSDPLGKTTGINQEGLFDNLYDGLLPALVGGVPAGALFFGVKDYSKKKLRKLGLGKQESTVLSVCLTNIPYWIVRTPSEVLKTRRQIGYDNSSSVGEMMSKMVEQEGGVLPAIKSTYGSYASNFAYALPADIVKFVAYEAITSSVLRIKEGAKIEGLQAAATGAVASLIAQAVTTPLDVARTRIMSRTDQADTQKIIKTDKTQKTEKTEKITTSNQIKKEGREEKGGKETQKMKDLDLNTNDPLKELSNVLESEGPGSLFSGLLPRAVRALASGGIQFASYELTQNALIGR